MLCFNCEFGRYVVVLLEFSSGYGNTDTEALDITEYLESFSDQGIPVVCDPRGAEVLPIDYPIRSAGVEDLHPIREPVEPNR